MATANPARGAFVRQRSEAETMGLMGVTITVLVGSDDSPHLSLFDYRAEAGAPGPVLHVHRESTEWFHVTEGQFTFEVEGQQTIAESGAVVYVTPGTRHRFWNSHDGASRMTIGFDRPGMEGYFRELFQFVKAQPSWPPKDLTKLAQLAARYDTFNAVP